MNKNEMNSLPDEFDVWLSERHQWLQTAARQLVDNKRPPDDDELPALAKLCICEATGTKGAAFRAVVPGSLALASAQPPLRITGLTNVRGINAIKDGVSLLLGQENIAVIYGPNGSGKTGFSRLLKQACGSRSKEDVLANVFDAAAPSPAARVVVETGGQEGSLDWTVTGGAIPQLRHVHVFDAKTASMYVVEKNEATYEPSRMRFVSALVKISDRVAAHIEVEKNKLVGRLPQVPAELTTTPSMQWIAALRAGTGQVAIDKACDYPVAMDADRIAIETALGQKDISGRLQAITRDKAALSQIATALAQWKEQLSDSTMERLVAARNDAKIKRQTASDDAKKVFAQSPLEGVGQASWLALWEQAREYSEAHAYPGATFPQTAEGAVCVLCQQQLQPAGRERLDHFQAFVMGGLEANAKRAEQLRDDLMEKLPKMPLPEDWTAKATVLKLDETVAATTLLALKARCDAAMTAIRVADIPAFDWAALDQPTALLMSTLEAEEKSLKAS